MAAKLLLVDASSSIFRAFYALPPLTNAAGVPTNATLGFATMIQKLLRERRPDYAVVVWDAPGPKRRKEIYPEYKAHRDAAPEDLKAQFPWVRRVAEAMRLASLEVEGEEADDVIAVLVRQAREHGLAVEIASTDKDLMQLVGDDVVLLDTTKDRAIGPEQVRERFGVPPGKLLDVRALVGDSSDNIPGVRGIGEKGAAKLVLEFGSLDALLDRVDEIEPKRAREALREQAELARLSRELSRLADDLPVELDLEHARPGPPDRAALAALYRELGFTRLLADLEANRVAPAAALVEGTAGAAGPAAAKGARTPMLFDDVQLSPGARAERAKSPAAEGGLAEPGVEIVRDLASLRALVERLAAGGERLGLDCVVEPEDAMRGALVAVTLARSPDHAWLVALSEVGESDALEALQSLLEARDRTWAGVDLKRCAVALRHRGVSICGELRDAGVAAYVADPSLPSERPELLAKAFLGVDLPSPEESFGKGARRRPFSEVESSELASFFGARTAYALALLERLEAELCERGQLELYERLEVPLVGILARMEHAGVRIDENRLAELSAHIRSELDSLTRRIHDLAGEEFNIGSPQQLQRILFDKLRLTPGKRTKTGFSTDESVLEMLSAEHELPREILVHRRLSKLVGTYVDALPDLVHPETGRIHCRFNQTVTATGRLSSSNPNLQNIPIRTPLGQRIRAAFVPAEGFELLSADYSQIELRIVAHLSGDRGLIDAFREGADIHVRTAAQVFGVAPEEVDPELRARTKAINFGIIYGQGPFGLAQQLGISQMEAREHIRAYFERYPGVKSFLERSVAEARRRGYSETLFGRRRYLPDLRSKNRTVRAAAERMASNAVIQGTAADFIKRAMVEIQTELDRSGAPRARMILQVHDELVFEVAPRDVGVLASIVEARMQGVAELSVPLEVHVGHGMDWLAAH